MTREQRVGLFFIVGMVLFGVAIELTVGTGLFERGYVLWAEFPDVQGLREGAEVRVGGVEAGAVEGVQLAADRVRVKLRVHSGVTVRRGAAARLDFQALTGQRFVAIDLGDPAAAPLSPGETIVGQASVGFGELADRLGEVVASVQELTDRVGNEVTELLASVSALVEENRATLASTLESIGSISAKVDEGTGTLGRLVNDPSLYEETAESLSALRESAGDIRRVARQLAEGRGTLGRLLMEEDLYDDLREASAHLSTTAENAAVLTSSLRDGEGTIGRLISDDELYDDAQRAVRGLNRATQGLEDQAPISVLGALVSTLF